MFKKIIFTTLCTITLSSFVGTAFSADEDLTIVATNKTDNQVIEKMPQTTATENLRTNKVNLETYDSIPHEWYSVY